MQIEKRMAQVAARITKAREELRIIEEQMLFQMDVVEETKVRMAVAETPLADREYRVARDDYERMVKERDRINGEIAELQREQDRILDDMSA